MANAIRNYFGDGSEFGVRMVYATEETPLGTAGSVRNAMDELDERFLVISGDVLTDIDLGSIVAFHDEKRGAGHHRAGPRSRTRSSSASSSPSDDGSIERFLEKPTWGQVFSDTINTGIFVLEPEIFDYIAAGPAGRLLQRGVPRAARRRASRSSAPSPRATGRTSARSRPTCGPTRTSSTARSQVDIPGFELGDGVWLGEGAEIHPDATRRRARPSSATTAGSRPAPASGEYTVLGANVRVRADADLERVVVHDNAYLGEGVRLRGAVVGRACDLRSGVRCEEGVVLGDECFVGERRRPRRRREGVPVQDGRGAAPSSTPRSCGRAGAPAACSAATAWPAWPTSTSPPSSPPGWPWPTARTLKKGSTVITSRDSSRSARMLKRAMMAGLNAAGVNVLDLEVASVPGHPVPSSAGPTPRAASPSASSRATRSRCVIRFFDSNGADIAEDAPAQDRAALQPGGLPPGVPGRDRRHRLPAPGPRALHRRPRGHRRHRGHPRRAGFKVVVDYALRLDVVRHAERAGQAGRRRAGREPLRRPPPGRSDFDRAAPRRAAWPAWCGRPAPTSAR